MKHADEYPLFDWLRIILASGVALYHQKIFTWEHSGDLAVQVFFALSGWLIGGILLDTAKDELPRFFFNRATRVWMPYFAAILALYGLSASREPVDARWLEFLAYDVTFTHNWFTLRPDAATAIAQMPLNGTGNHFWSLAVEEQFYLFAPLLILFAKGGRTIVFWIAVSALAYATASQYGAISLGVLAATLQRHFPDWHLRYSAPIAVVLALSVVGMIFAYAYGAPIFGITVVLLAARPGARGPAGKLLGGMSYPFYLNHWIGGFVAHGLTKRVGLSGTPIDQWGGYVLGLIAGAVAYVAIDQQILKRRAGLYTPSRGRWLGATAYALLLCGVVFGFR